MNSIKTPKWNSNFLSKKDVYEPAEDSFLLLDAIERDLNNLTTSQPKIIVEIGSGSGIIISALATIFKSRAFCLAVDINKDACEVSNDTAQLNDAQVDIIHSNMLDSLLLRENIDLIVFNPPYVATSHYETMINGITRSWAGGESGRRIVDILLPLIPQALSTEGIFYLVAISYNDIEDIIGNMAQLGLEGEIIMERQIPGELLSVIKFVKKPLPSC